MTQVLNISKCCWDVFVQDPIDLHSYHTVLPGFPWVKGRSVLENEQDIEESGGVERRGAEDRVVDMLRGER